jgi:hypothetical protein
MTADEAKRAADRIRAEAASNPNTIDQETPAGIVADVERAIEKSKATQARARAIVAESVRSTESKKTMMSRPFHETFAEAVTAVRMSDPTLTLEQLHERATKKCMREAKTSSFVTMGAPTDPTPAPPAIQAQYDALDDHLLQTAVAHAQQVATDNKPKPQPPPLGKNYEAALELISRSPMPKEQALKLARDAWNKDREIQIAREAAVSSPSPPGNVNQVRA